MTHNLNLGCSNVTGAYKGQDWVNLDLIKHDNVNVIGSGTKLPFADNSFQKIHCIHVLEHVRRNLYLPMLREMYRVLEPGGQAYIEVPDFMKTIETLVKSYHQGDHLKVHIWTTSVYGKNERPGMAHFLGLYSTSSRD